MIEYTLLEQDLIASVRMQRKRWRTGIVGIFWFWLPLLIALSFVLWGAWLVIMGPWYGFSSDDGYWYLGVSAYFLIVMGLVHVLTPLGISRRYKKIGLDSIPMRLDWDEEKLITENEYNKSSIPWKDFSRWYENQQLFKLYFRKLLPKIIPKRVLSEAQIADIRRHLQQQVGPEGVMRKTRAQNKG